MQSDFTTFQMGYVLVAITGSDLFSKEVWHCTSYTMSLIINRKIPCDNKLDYSMLYEHNYICIFSCNSKFFVQTHRALFLYIILLSPNTYFSWIMKLNHASLHYVMLHRKHDACFVFLCCT